MLHVSDTHVGVQSRRYPFLFKDTLEAFKETVDIAIRERVNVYVHAGDFFDRASPPPEAYLVVYRNLKRLKEAGIKVVAVAGQHDLSRHLGISPLDFFSMIDTIDLVAVDDVLRTTIADDGSMYEFILVPFNKRMEIARIKPTSRNSIVVAHTLLKELEIPTTEFTPSLRDFDSSFCYIALGDYHIFREFRHPESGVKALYPGATETLRIDEIDPQGKSVVLIDLSKCGDEVSYTRLKLQSSRPWITAVLTNYIEVSNFVKTLTSESRMGVKKPVVIVKAFDELASRRAETELSKLVDTGIIEYYSVETISKAENQQLVQTDADLTRIDIDGILRDVLKTPELVDFVKSLISEETPTNMKNIARNFLSIIMNDDQLLDRIYASLLGKR